MLFSLPVLLYNSISMIKSPLAVSPLHFEEQCRQLRLAEWHTLTLHEAETYLLHNRELPPHSCLLTFDDGYLDHYVYTTPILTDYRLHGTFFPVAGLLEANGPLRPTLDDRRLGTDHWNDIAGLDTQDYTQRSTIPVNNIRFCSWDEIRYMRQKRHMDIAPHSMRHETIVTGPEFTELFCPTETQNFFHVPPTPWPWGMPQFSLGSAFAGKAFHIAPEVFERVRSIVPQNQEDACTFLADPKNRKAVTDAVAALPTLGTFESDAEQRMRFAVEFAECQETFQRELGVCPITFCWPWGTHCDTALQEAQKAGFKLFIGTANSSDKNTPHIRRFRIPSVSGNALLRRMRMLSCDPIAALYGMLKK